MEPPAVTSCGVGSHSVAGQHPQTQKRDNAHVGFLQIEPQISFNTNSRHFEELPENFLETMSPQQQHAGHVHPHQLMMSSSINIGGGTSHDVIVHSTTSPQLASLTTVSMAGGSTNGNSGYASLIPMPSSSHYISTLKMESMEHLGSHGQLQSSQMEKTTFGNGPAGLLSPLQLESNRNDSNSLGILGGIHHHSRPNGGRTSDLLSGIRRNDVSYVKEEMNPSEIGYQTTHDYDGNYSMQQPTAQELERMANAETPPALSNVEITSSILASLSNDSPSPNIRHQQSSPQTHFIVHQIPRQQHIIHQTQSGSRSSGSRKSKQQNHQQEAQRLASQNAINIDTYSSIDTGTNYAQLNDMNDPLNAEIDDEIYIDTKDLCKRVAYELKQHSIPQAIFAERILCRSQGTLSDLLRNPKPWNRLKSGRETFKRMYNWLQQPLHTRLNILDMFKGPMPSNVIPPPTPAQNSRHHHRRRTSGDDGQAQKRPRLVFTDIQKRTLQAIFKETQRPSREMQQTIAEHLRLDMSTVSNFFMNARRRSRNGNGLGDEPAPYQQIRTITPPPDSPPTAQQHQMLDEHQQSQHNLPTNRRNKSSSISHQTTSASNLSHIEQTVDEVVGRSIAYARKSQYAPAISQTIIDNQQPVWEEEVQIQNETEMPFDESGVIVQDNLETIEMVEDDGENNDKNDDSTEDHIQKDIDGEKAELNSENDRKSVERESENIKEEVALEEEETPNKKEMPASNPKESPLNDGQASTAPGTPTKCDEPEKEDGNKNEGSADDNKNDKGEDEEASASIDDDNL